MPMIFNRFLKSRQLQVDFFSDYCVSITIMMTKLRPLTCCRVCGRLVTGRHAAQGREGVGAGVQQRGRRGAGPSRTPAFQRQLLARARRRARAAQPAGDSLGPTTSLLAHLKHNTDEGRPRRDSWLLLEVSRNCVSAWRHPLHLVSQHNWECWLHIYCLLLVWFMWLHLKRHKNSTS